MSDTDDELLITCDVYIVTNSLVKKRQKSKLKKDRTFWVSNIFKVVFLLWNRFI